MASAASFRDIVGMSPSTASPSNSTLIIIDAQNEYAEGKLKVSNVASSRKAIASLLQKYRDANGKIVHVTHVVPDGAPVFTPKTKLAEEFEEIEPKSGEKVVRKLHPSAFADTDLQEHLKSEKSEKIVLTGYMVSCGNRCGYSKRLTTYRLMFAYPRRHETELASAMMSCSQKMQLVTEISLA